MDSAVPTWAESGRVSVPLVAMHMRSVAASAAANAQQQPQLLRTHGVGERIRIHTVGAVSAGRIGTSGHGCHRW